MPGLASVTSKFHQNSHDKGMRPEFETHQMGHATTQFDIEYVPQKEMKGQALVDFLASRPLPKGSPLNDPLSDQIVLSTTSKIHWELFFYGASHINQVGERVTGVRVLLADPNGCLIPHAFKLAKSYSNNIAEYQALIIGTELAIALHITHLHILTDSQLIINHLRGE